MSETIKATDSAKKAADQTARSGQSAVETATKVTKDTVVEAGKATQDAVERMGEAGKGVNETMRETAHSATRISSAMADQSGQAMLTGTRALADAGGKIADINFGRSRDMISSAAHAMDIYRDAAERSASRVQALMSSAMTLGRGLTSMQHAWIEMIDHSMETAAHKPQDLLRCKTMAEFAEVQRDLYLDAINHAFESTSRLLDIAGRTAQDAVRPLRS